MSFWTDLRMPTEQELLIGFYDLSGYTRYAEHTEPQRLLDVMAGYFALTGQIVQDAGGRLIKTLGDAGLAAFPAEQADPAVRAVQALRSKGRDWLAQHDYKSNVVVKLHLGPVAIGKVGSPGEEIIDVYGKTVNVAATLPSAGLGHRFPPCSAACSPKRGNCSRSTHRRSAISTRTTGVRRDGSTGEEASRRLAVRRDLRLELVEAGELHLGPDEIDQRHPQVWP